MELTGAGNRILLVDLTSGASQVVEVGRRERELFLGGKGLGLWLLERMLPVGCDPLGPQNVLALMPGVLAGTGAPCSARFMALAKSPLTGLIAASSCGGPFGIALRTAGWGGLVIRGRAPRPSWLLVNAEGAKLRDARELWGRTIPATQAALAGPRRGLLAIGPAGENLVRFANVASGERYLGRGGLGAVLGAKLLKAVAVQGGAYRVVPADPEGLARLKQRATDYINRDPITGDLYRKYGTNANVRLNQQAGLLPVRNFADGWHPQAELLYGETLAARHQTRHHTCKPCTILCGHRGAFADGTAPVPEYETVGLLGLSLGITDSEAVAVFNQTCGELGLDTISAGGTLAWVMEASERGLVKSDLRFGSPAGVAEALVDIAHRRGFGEEMALGSRELARRHGGLEFAMQVKGLELAGYDPRGSIGQGLAYAVANRGGCHLSAFMVGMEVFLAVLRPHALRAKARHVKFLEDLTCCINSLQTCQFTSFAFLMQAPLTRLTPRPLLAALMQELPWLAQQLVDIRLYSGMYSAVTGIPMPRRAFLKAGERIHVLERHLNCLHGLTADQDTLPARLLTQARAGDPERRAVPLAKLLPAYYRLRGYGADGRPTAATLARLDLA